MCIGNWKFPLIRVQYNNMAVWFQIHAHALTHTHSHVKTAYDILICSSYTCLGKLWKDKHMLQTQHIKITELGHPSSMRSDQQKKLLLHLQAARSWQHFTCLCMRGNLVNRDSILLKTRNIHLENERVHILHSFSLTIVLAVRIAAWNRQSLCLN